MQCKLFTVYRLYTEIFNIYMTSCLSLQKDVEDMIKEGDLDEDGRINLEEFTIIMNSQ